MLFGRETVNLLSKQEGLGATHRIVFRTQELS